MLPDLGFGVGCERCSVLLLLLPALGAGRGSFGRFAKFAEAEALDDDVVVVFGKIDVEAVVGGSGGQ